MRPSWHFWLLCGLQTPVSSSESPTPPPHLHFLLPQVLITTCDQQACRHLPQSCSSMWGHMEPRTPYVGWCGGTELMSIFYSTPCSYPLSACCHLKKMTYFYLLLFYGLLLMLSRQVRATKHHWDYSSAKPSPAWARDSSGEGSSCQTLPPVGAQVTLPLAATRATCGGWLECRGPRVVVAVWKICHRAGWAGLGARGWQV